MKYLIQETETGEIILKKGIHYFTEQEEKQHIASGFQSVDDVGFYINLTPVSVPTLEEVKEAKIKELKQIRNTFEVSPIEYEGNLFDYDEDSRDRISIARQAMEDGLMESITWTTADNQRVEITLEDFKGINSLSALRSNGLHVKYNNKKAEVQKAETIKEVEGIKWEGCENA